MGNEIHLTPAKARTKMSETQKKEHIRVDIDNGKYTVLLRDGEQVQILRHGEAWMGPGFAGENCVLAMAGEIEQLRGDARRFVAGEKAVEALIKVQARLIRSNVCHCTATQMCSRHEVLQITDSALSTLTSEATKHE